MLKFWFNVIILVLLLFGKLSSLPIEELDVKKDIKNDVIFYVNKNVKEEIKADVKNWDSFWRQVFQ